ncbi:MAG TPA: DUF420 domain-containing protein [Candidatus Acidoferrales bacterium]|nr:DUF420 domain-containing protein [Candidatus Acidoferrales bacterium]
MLPLPELNACLNASSAVLLLAGYRFIRRRKIRSHHWCMLSAFGFSTLFLTGYIAYHAMAGVVPFRRAGWLRVVYFSILIPHSILAAAVVPLAIVTLTFALRGKFDRHRRWARWTFPIWLFVSVTGVVVYWMLFRL